MQIVLFLLAQISKYSFLPPYENDGGEINLVCDAHSNKNVVFFQQQHLFPDSVFQ